jgi:PAS domain S-box-containing protein
MYKDQHNVATRLQRSILIASAIGIAAISIIVALITVIPHYQHLREDAESDLTQAVKTRSLAIEEYLSRISDIALQITSRTQIRVALEEYNRGERTLESLRAFSIPKLADALAKSPEVAGMVRFDMTGTAVVTLGKGTPPSLWMLEDFGSMEVIIYDPVEIDSTLYLLVKAPIMGEEGIVGTDLVLFKMSRLEEIAGDMSGLGRSSHMFLGTYDAGEVHIFFSCDTRRMPLPDSALTPPVIAGFLRASKGEQGILVPEQNRFGNEEDIIAYGPIYEEAWAIVLSQDTTELYGSAHRSLAILVSMIVGFLIVGVLGITRLLQPLAGKMVLHADELERDIAEKTFSLQMELRERRRAEEALLVINRLLEMISACNQALAHASDDESGTMQSVCNIIVEIGGYRLAWVGLTEEADASPIGIYNVSPLSRNIKLVEPIACAGYRTGDPKPTTIHWLDTEEQSPTKYVIEQRSMWVATHITTNPDLHTFHAEATHFGYDSCIILPLNVNGRTVGALHIYHTASEGFAAEEAKLLSELAGDLSYGLSTIRARVESRRAFEEVERLKHHNELILENIGEGIFGLDNEGRTTFVNRSATRLLGYTANELIGELHHELVHHSYPSGDPYPIDRCRISNFVPGERIGRVEDEVFWRKDGTSFPISYLSIPMIEHGERVGIVVTFQDITERKQAEEDLRHAKEAAETATRAKSEFLANMSHEIRTPMNAVIGMTTLLLDTSLSLEQRDFVETIRTSGSALLTIINDIIDFSKIEAGKMELEYQPFELRTCIEESLDLVTPAAAEKHIDLTYLIQEGTPDTIIGDITRLRQILVNLLSNAVKFTEEGSVTVMVESEGVVDPPVLPAPMGEELEKHNAHDRRTHHIHFAVSDTGIGIPKDRLYRLFESFSQTDSSMTRKYGGTGLGLAISKRLSQMMNGTMWVESEVDKGSTFHIRIQAMESPSIPKRHFHRKLPQLVGKRVLVVDDNPMNRFVLTHQLESWGIEPWGVGSAREALDLLNEDSQFDLAILDLHMPDMDGLTLATEIRKSEGGVSSTARPSEANSSSIPLIPLVLLPSMEPGRQALKDTGVTFAACLTKPVKPAVLHQSLLNIFSGEMAPPTERQSARQQLDSTMAQRHPLRILVAEDNVVNQKVILRLLERMGYRADVAANGREVLESLSRQPYDVVLMDVQMPEMDGLEATRIVRQRWPNLDIYIIAMTAHALDQDREQCIAAGMDNYVSKPIQVAELVDALEAKRSPSLHEKGNT